MRENASVLTKKKLIEDIIIPNIPSQYSRKSHLHYEEADYFRDLATKLTNIIPKNEEHVNKRDKTREHNEKDTRDHRDRKQTSPISDSKKVLETNVDFKRDTSGLTTIKNQLTLIKCVTKKNRVDMVKDKHNFRSP